MGYTTHKLGARGHHATGGNVVWKTPSHRRIIGRPRTADRTSKGQKMEISAEDGVTGAILRERYADERKSGDPHANAGKREEAVAPER